MCGAERRWVSAGRASFSWVWSLGPFSLSCFVFSLSIVMNWCDFDRFLVLGEGHGNSHWVGIG